MDYSDIFRIIELYDLNFIPIWPGRKNPLVKKWSQYQKEKVPMKEFKHKYFYPGAKNGIAIIGGAISHELFIIDVDNNDFAMELADLLPETLIIKTSKGLHFYYFEEYAIPLDRYEFRINESDVQELFGIDVKAEGGYVIAPPSIHPSGIHYSFYHFANIERIKYDTIIKIILNLANKHNYFIKKVINADKKIKKVKEKTYTKKERFVNSNIQELEDVLPSLSSMIGFEGNGPHPIHDSKGGKNLSVNGDQWFCFRHWSGGGKFQWYALQKGIADCSEGRNKQLKLSTQQWKEVFQSIREEYNLQNEFIKFIPKKELTEKQKLGIEKRRETLRLKKEQEIKELQARGILQ